MSIQFHAVIDLYILDSWSEGPMKYSPVICLFAYLSRVFLQKHLLEFSDFLHKVRVSSSLNKKLELEFLEKKIFSALFRPKVLKMGLKWGFSGLMKNENLEFSDFLHEVAKTWSLIFKINEEGPKGAKIDPKWDFKFYEILRPRVFVIIFPWNYSSI